MSEPTPAAQPTSPDTIIEASQAPEAPAAPADAAEVAPAKQTQPEPEQAKPTTEEPATAKAGSKPATLIVHHLNNSRSQRILWLLEELEIPYEIKKYQRTAEMRAPPELKKVHPLGKSPVITDGDVTVAESGAIVEYLLTKYGQKLQPPEAGKNDNVYYSHYAEGSLMPILVNKMIFGIIPQRAPIFIRPLIKPIFATLDKKMILPQLKDHSDMIEAHLVKTNAGWFAGGENPTMADFMMLFPLEAWFTRGEEFLGPKTKEYIKRSHERPAYKRGLDKGGKYDYAS